MKCALFEAGILVIAAAGIAWMDMGRREPIKMEVVGIKGQIVAVPQNGSDRSVTPATTTDPTGHPEGSAAGGIETVDEVDPEVSAPVVSPTAAADFVEVTVDAAAQAYSEGFTTFIDARPMDEYIAGHVPDAILMPPSAFYGGQIPAVIDELAHEDPILVYCGGGDCDASHEVVKRLRLLGFTNLYIMTAGYPGWKEAGHEIRVGAPESDG